MMFLLHRYLAYAIQVMANLAQDAWRLAGDPEHLPDFMQIEQQRAQEIIGGVSDIFKFLLEGMSYSTLGRGSPPLMNCIIDSVDDFYNDINCPWSKEQWQLILEAVSCVAANDRDPIVRKEAAKLHSKLERSVKRRTTLRSWTRKK